MLEQLAEKMKVLKGVVVSVEKQFGKGAIMSLGDEGALDPVPTIPSGSLALDLATGAGLIPTSVFVHLVAPVVGVAAVRRLGWPPRAWVAATMASALLLVVTRLTSSPRPNVNLAFRVHDGWERYFTSHFVFVGLLLVGSAVLFFAIDVVVVRLLGRRRTS